MNLSVFVQNMDYWFSSASARGLTPRCATEVFPTGSSECHESAATIRSIWRPSILFTVKLHSKSKDEFWKDGGPVIGVQLENEYAWQGADQGAAHILKLKQMAVADGFDVPLYTVTGWDGAYSLRTRCCPCLAATRIGPGMIRSRNFHPMRCTYFRFESREGGDIGAPGGRPASHATQAELAGYPFLSAEFGSGIEDTYHRRPIIHASDVAAMLPTQLGSGVNLMGYYMFHGGANPPGKLTTLQESQATGASNDLPKFLTIFKRRSANTAKNANRTGS